MTDKIKDEVLKEYDTPQIKELRQKYPFTLSRLLDLAISKTAGLLKEVHKKELTNIEKKLRIAETAVNIKFKAFGSMSDQMKLMLLKQAELEVELADKEKEVEIHYKFRVDNMNEIRKLRSKLKTQPKAIFDERSEVWIMNAIGLLHQMIDSDKTDINDMKWILGKLERQQESDEELKKKWCDDVSKDTSKQSKE